MSKARQVNVHPNSMAARKWKRTTITSYVNPADTRPGSRPSASLGAAKRRRGRGAYTTREEARKVACPFCDADVGNYCTRRNGKLRLDAHTQRHALALKTGAALAGHSTRKQTSERSSTARDKR